MKKLMTILSATAFAVIAVGAVNGDELNTGTGFETGAYSLGGNLNTEKDDAGDDLEDEAYRVWGSIPDLESGVAVVSNWNGEYEVADGNNQYLKLDSAPLISRYAQAGGTAVDIGKGLYIDTLVQFTAADPENPPTPDIDGGDKLCIWLADNEEDPTQCTLMVTAGFVEDEYGGVVVTNYATSKIIANNTWHHLQVKILPAIDSDDTGWLSDGFVVFIDGTAVTTTVCPIDAGYVDSYTLNQSAAEYFNDGAYAIFPSMIPQGATGDGTITSLSFKGSGAVDELKFTDTDPIPPTPSADDWVDDPTEIADNTPAATQYPALAGSALATADAKKLTVWATANSITFDTIKDDTTGTYTDAYLLNCALAEVEDEKDEFVVNISFDSVTGEPVVTKPTGKTYNGTFKVYGSDDLTTPKASWHEQTDGDTFFYGVLSL